MYGIHKCFWVFLGMYICTSYVLMLGNPLDPDRIGRPRHWDVNRDGPFLFPLFFLFFPLIFCSLLVFFFPEKAGKKVARVKTSIQDLQDMLGTYTIV